MIPSLTAGQFESVITRSAKCMHFTNICVLPVGLSVGGVRGDRRGWRWTWGVTALCCAAGYSVLDEIHQAFVASRTAFSLRFPGSIPLALSPPSRAVGVVSAVGDRHVEEEIGASRTFGLTHRSAASNHKELR